MAVGATSGHARTTFTVLNANQLSAAITTIDLESQGGTGNSGAHYFITLAAPTTWGSGLENGDITAINLKGTDALTINGVGNALNGGGTYRGLFVYSGHVTIENLTIENAVANGGAGGAAPANVTLDNVFFTHDSAVGGAGGAVSGSSTLRGSGAGGGGLGGAGGSSAVGGGGVGLIPGATSGGAGGTGFAGGANGGGGGDGGSVSTAWGGGGGGGGVGGGSSGSSVGGVGGFGGGGGGGGFTPFSGGAGNSGGFGGGGGGGDNHYGAAGIGGFGGGGGGGFGGGGGGGFASGAGGFGGGHGGAGGGGGLGAGGDIFVMAGALLTIEGGNLAAGTVTAGLGANGAGAGSSYGGAIFLQGNETITLEPPSGKTMTISAAIADQTGSSGTGANAGAGGLILNGAGTLDLAAVNTFTGGVTIEKGELELSNSAAAGSGKITFSTGAGATLDLLSGNALGATISGFGSGDKVDFDAVKFASTDSVAYASGIVSIDNSTGARIASFEVTLGTYNFNLSANPSDGSLVVSDPAMPMAAAFDFAAASPTAGIPEPSTWILMLVGFAGLGYAGHRTLGVGGRGYQRNVR
jgi:hypothetical protein